MSGSGRSDTAAFDMGLDNRDVFLGQRRCVICGINDSDCLKHCHIAGHSDVAMVRRMYSGTHVRNNLSSFQWTLLQQLG
jgi:hypothetical protein